MPKPFSLSEKELIQARLLEHGYRLFSAYGLKKTNIEEIAQAVGISKGAFYLFYQSKEALFMDVIEQAEIRFREEILAAVDRPGPTPRLRLYAIFEQAFSLVKTMPILQAFTSGDYDVVLRRVPTDTVRQHLDADRVFINELVARCQASGIPITAPVEQIYSLMYSLLFAFLHEQDLGALGAGASGILIELIAAFCLGEVTLQAPIDQKDRIHEPGN